MPADAEPPLTYDDLLRIVEIVKVSERFSQFHLKLGDIEIELHRRRTQARPDVAAQAGDGKPRAPVHTETP